MLNGVAEITFRGHSFGITGKPTRVFIVLYNNVGFTVGNFEKKS